jgi:16S rRNA U1498 N3-methylase RsmE
VALAEPGGGQVPAGVDTIIVGPEGGFSPDELAVDVPRVGLADTILRVETAALVAAVALHRSAAIDAA